MNSYQEELNEIAALENQLKDISRKIAVKKNQIYSRSPVHSLKQKITEFPIDGAFRRDGQAKYDRGCYSNEVYQNYLLPLARLLNTDIFYGREGNSNKIKDWTDRATIKKVAEFTDDQVDAAADFINEMAKVWNKHFVKVHPLESIKEENNA